tara:strand:- start:470 stop:757 length:288 start_codon:yes stop_codon:yes gene_type:complete
MKIVRINKGSWGKVRAFFDLETSDGFTIKGFKMVQGENGIFIGFPSQEKDGEYHDTVWANKDIKKEVEELAKIEYDNPSGIQSDKEPVVEEEIPF